MSQNMREFARILRRHLARRHPNQSWVARLLLRFMSWETLLHLHANEHERFADLMDHDDGDFHGHSYPPA